MNQVWVKGIKGPVQSTWLETWKQEQAKEEQGRSSFSASTRNPRNLSLVPEFL